MPLMILGLIFVVGLFAWYMLSTSGSSDSDDTPPKDKPKERPHRPDDNLRKEDNVIYLSDNIEQIKKNHNIGTKE